MRFRSRAALAAVALVAVGCTHRSHPAPAPTTSLPSAPATTSSTTPPGPVTTPPTSAPASTNPTSGAAASAPCTTAGLTGSLINLGTAAGSTLYELALKDTAAGPCTLDGYPGVSFVDAHGAQLGAPATDMTGPGGPVRLTLGASAAIRLAYHDGYLSTGPECQPTAAAGIRVYPPGRTDSLIVPTSLVVCANRTAQATASVSPVTTPANVQP